jgi:hypothetical protein
MPYGRPDKAEMDLAHRYGLKVIYSIKDYYAGTRWSPEFIKTKADERSAVEKTVREYRNHPALLAWYLNDELPARMAERLITHQRWLEKLDPNHPTWAVLYQVGELRAHLATCDILGTDPYPIPDASPVRALDWTRRAVAAGFGLRPVWQVPQIFDWGAYRQGDARRKTRAPTPAEMRSMAWQCIAGGANGLIFYSWFDLWKMANRDPFAKRWAEVRELAAEIARYFPVLLSVDRPAIAPTSVQAPASVGWRVWGKGVETYLLVVNGETTPTTVTLSFPSPTTGGAAEFGPAPKRRGDREFMLRLAPLEPALLRFTAKSAK